MREISVVSLTEIALKQTRGKLTFGKADATAGVADLRLRILPVFRGACLPPLRSAHTPRGFFDRQIIAQALAENVPVVTPDESFQLYEGLKVVW